MWGPSSWPVWPGYGWWPDTYRPACRPPTAHAPLVRLLALLPGEEEVLKLPNNLYSLLPEDILGGMEVEEETDEEVEMVEKRVASVDSFLDIGVPVKRLSKKTCLTRNLKQEDWKQLRADILKAVNEKTPNKSLKLCRKIFRSALANHSSYFQRRQSVI